MRKVKLGDICEALSDGLHAAPKFNPTGEYLFVNATNLEDGFIVDKGEGKRSDRSEYEKYRIDLNERTILYSIDGTIGNMARYHGEKVILGKGACYIKLDGSVDTDYIYYLLQGEHFKGYLKTMATGSTIHHISLETMRDYPLPKLPSISIQRSVGRILRSLDDKIANNKKLMVELEQTAQLIYDYWFTQFDFPDEDGNPYRSSGGKMVWNDTLKREIPEGWEVINLYGVADYINGLACQKHRPDSADPGLPVVKIREMHEGISVNTERVSSSIPGSNIINDGDLLFSWSASLEVQFWNGGIAGLNQHIFKVVPKLGVPSEYVYQQLARYLVTFRKMAEVRKTTMGHITSDHLSQSRIVLPPQKVLDQFSCAARQLRQCITQLGKQSQSLASLRDWLLPMLMNGQATVSE